MGNCILAPSVMCADYGHLESDIRQLEEAGCEYLHFDIMDGRFVPNITFGLDFLNAVRAMTDMPFSIHFMVERPEDYMRMFEMREGDLVSVHQESSYHLQRALSRINESGAAASVALCPATQLEVLGYVLADIRMLLLMTVNPGYAGQALVPAAMAKIRDARQYLDRRGFCGVIVGVDGNVSFENAPLMRQNGAGFFVCGSSSLFSKSGAIPENARRLRALLAP